MIKVNPSSINDLLALKAAGLPVTLTSHPGNASLYKLSLWSCGIPEHLWDVTCCVADANNWPMFRLICGQAELLLCEERYEQIKRETSPVRRFVTAYQQTHPTKNYPAKNYARLGRIHVRACEKCFPGRISSCSRLLLSHIDKVREVFSYLAETRPNQVFGRFITPDGMMIPIRESGLQRGELVDSFVNVLQELDHLLFSDEPIETRGGACYDGVIVPLATYLGQYWQTGKMDRYDISGPDMIHYATRPEHQESLSEMLAHLHRWNPGIIPANIVIRMFPGTVACIGHISGHLSEEIMRRKVDRLCFKGELPTSHRIALREKAKEDESRWPIQIKPNTDKYFSQHDLVLHGGSLEVDDFWKDIPLESMKERLAQANALLRIRNN